MVACLHCLLFMVGQPARARERLADRRSWRSRSAWSRSPSTCGPRRSGRSSRSSGSGWLVLIAARLRLLGLTTALPGGRRRWRSARRSGWRSSATSAVQGVPGRCAARRVPPWRADRDPRLLAQHLLRAWRTTRSLPSGISFGSTTQHLRGDARLPHRDRPRPTSGATWAARIPDFGGLKFAKYEPLVREMLIARCTTYVRECAEATAVLQAGRAGRQPGLAVRAAAAAPRPGHRRPAELGESRGRGEAPVPSRRRRGWTSTVSARTSGRRSSCWSLAPFALLLTLEPRAVDLDGVRRARRPGGWGA